MDILNWLKELLETALTWVINLLPDSPFQLLDNSSVAQYMPYLNYFVPVDFMISTLELWLVAVGVYYLYSAILRWVKAIQ